MEPSPRAHIYRLAILVIAIGVLLAVVRELSIPASWDHEKGYRLDAVPELQRLAIRYGGATSCGAAACHSAEQPTSHARQIEVLAGGSHGRLACEGCHGPISNHIVDGEPLERPPPSDPVALCLDCHRALLGRTAVPVFDRENPLHEAQVPLQYPSCPDCHDPHDPKVEL